MKKIIGLVLAVFLGSLLFAEEPAPSPAPVTAPTIPPEVMAKMVKQERGRNIFVPKDPLIAGLFSAELPGLGQIYCRKYLRGVTFLASEIGCFVLAASMTGLETHIYKWNAYDEETGEERELTQSVSITKWDDLSGMERGVVQGLILGGVALHIWNVIDAYNLAHEHNKRLGWLDNIDVKVGFAEDGPLLEFEWEEKF